LLTATVGLLLIAGLLSGCRQDEQQKPTPPPVVVQPKPTEKIELMPDTSEEFARHHFIDATGFEVETRIDYRNGDKAVIKFRANHSQESYKRTAKNGTVLIEQNFAADGKTITSGQELRKDLTLKWKATQDASGAVTTKTYWWDGTALFSEKVQQLPSGSYQTTFYRKDGTLWGKRSGPSDGVIAHEEQFNTSGKLEFTSERNGSDIVTTLYRADGTPEYRQHMIETTSSYGYTSRNLTSVEVLNADGKTVGRTLIMNSGGYSVSQVVRNNADGTTTVRDVTYNGTVTHEEKRDSSGKVLSQKDYSSSDGVREDWDWRATRTSSPDDPVNRWDLAERYPYYRQ